MSRRLLCAAALLTALLSLFGCIQRIYEVRMSPRADGTGWDRILTLTESRIEKDRDGKDVPRQESKVTPSTFNRDIVADMGNAGSITTYLTTLGTLTIYSERFRGQTAVASGLEARLDGAEESARLIGGWLMSEAGNWPGATNLQNWCEHDLTADMRDLAIHIWLTGVDRGGATDAVHSAGWLRVARFLTERGYLESDDLSMVSRVLTGGAETDAARRWIVRLLARKAGDATVANGGDPPEFLRTWEAVADSLNGYLRRQPEYAKLLAEAKAAAAESSSQPETNTQPPEPSRVFGDYLGAMLAGMVPLFPNEAGGWSETLDLEVSVPAEPFSTNGRWRADHRTVRWFTMVDAPNEQAMFPFYAFAQWAEPAEAAQKQAFGSAALRGRSLARYCLWRTGLTTDEGRIWDEAIAALRPESDAAGQLKDAGLRGGIPEQLLDSGINIVRDALDGARRSE